MQCALSHLNEDAMICILNECDLGSIVCLKNTSKEYYNIVQIDWDKQHAKLMMKCSRFYKTVRPLSKGANSRLRCMHLVKCMHRQKYKLSSLELQILRAIEKERKKLALSDTITSNEFESSVKMIETCSRPIHEKWMKLHSARDLFQDLDKYQEEELNKKENKRLSKEKVFVEFIMSDLLYEHLYVHSQCSLTKLNELFGMFCKSKTYNMRSLNELVRLRYDDTQWICISTNKYDEYHSLLTDWETKQSAKKLYMKRWMNVSNRAVVIRFVHMMDRGDNYLMIKNDVNGAWSWD